MTMTETPVAAPTDTSCFLCALDSKQCQTAQVEGTLRGARVEQRNGHAIPQVGLRRSDGAQVLVELLPSQTRFVQRLANLTTKTLHQLTVRVLHLTEPYIVTPVSGSAPYAVYRALPATLCILEPDLLLNITDLSNGNYCVRQEILRHLYPSGPSAATVRGNLIHAVFKEMLKRSTARQEDAHDEDAAIDVDIAELLDAGLRAALVSIAQVGVTEQEVRAEAMPHLESLKGWLTQQRAQLWATQPRVRAETFLLAPEIGLKGRLDILWEDAHARRLLELKTGRAVGDLPKQDHRWQVYGYHALLTARRKRAPQATLLYSGTPDRATGIGIPAALSEIVRVLDVRNELALVRVTGTVPPPPGGKKCERCMQRANCAAMAPVLGWQMPPGEPVTPIPTDDAAWFRHWNTLQRLEARAADKATHALWQQSAQQRIAAGLAIGNLEQLDVQEDEKHEWSYRFRCDNTSELREGDEILLSAGNPVHEEVVSGSVLKISSNEIRVWAREEIQGAKLIDRYSSDITSSRMLGNLTRWLHVDDHRRSLVRGTAKPRFDIDMPPINPALLAGLNGEQANAVVRALTMKDYLLIQGPPGTGKTKVIAAMTKALLSRGYRVALGAFTNQATDNMLRQLVKADITNAVRLGHKLAVAPDLREYRLVSQTATQSGVANPPAEAVRDVLRKTPVVAATVATWSSDEHEVERTMPPFDVMIIDEATQLTVPAVLGALRWGKRFVLVGDEKQLPPLVQHEDQTDYSGQSETARLGGLGTSLFETLLEGANRDSCVALLRQYRMHEEIGAFPSRQFYDNKLKADPSVAHVTLPIVPTSYEHILNPAQPLVWVEVAPESAQVSPKLNVTEASVAATLARAFVASGVAPVDIGIIAPFRAQAARIRQLIADLVAEDATIDTVDRFQGGERSVIILSLVAATPPQPDSPLATFLSDARRLNVALTRARHKLVILGHQPALAGLPLLRDLAAHCATQEGGVVVWDGKR